MPEIRRYKYFYKKLGLVENCCYFSTYYMDSSPSISETSENVFLLNQISNRKYLLMLIKRRSKVRPRNISRERGLKFDQ